MSELWAVLRTTLIVVAVGAAFLFLREKIPVGASFASVEGDSIEAEAQAHASDLRIGNPELNRYVVAFNSIGPVPYREPATLIASIGSKSAREAVAQTRLGHGPVRTAKADFTGYVRAHLTGPSNFVTIDGDGSNVKFVGPSGNATWRWQVVPKSLRPTRVTLTFFNLVRRDGELVELPGPTYYATINVVPTWSSRARDLGEEYQNVIPILAIMTPLFSGIIGFFFGKWWESRSAPQGRGKGTSGSRRKKSTAPPSKD